MNKKKVDDLHYSSSVKTPSKSTKSTTPPPLSLYNNHGTFMGIREHSSARFKLQFNGTP
jgi:hypothetical protein